MTKKRTTKKPTVKRAQISSPRASQTVRPFTDPAAQLSAPTDVAWRGQGHAAAHAPTRESLQQAMELDLLRSENERLARLARRQERVIAGLKTGLSALLEHSNIDKERSVAVHGGH